MIFLSYLIAILKITAILKGIKIIVLMLERQLEWLDLIDFRPFGKEHLKIRDLAIINTNWKKPLYLALLYSYSFFVTILILGTVFVLIYNRIRAR